MGVAVMGTGVAAGDNRAVEAAKKAVSSPLLEDASIEGARGVIINVTGGPDLSLVEVSEASSIIQEAAHEDANIIFGAVVDPQLSGTVKITVIATGFERAGRQAPVPSSGVQTPVDLQNYAAWFKGRGEGAIARPTPRQPVVELPVREPAPAAPRLQMAESADELAGGEAESPFDVPAFLRHQREA